MHIAYIVIFAIVSIVGAAPSKDPIDDVKHAVEETEALMANDETIGLFAVAEAIVSNRIAPREEIEKWQALLTNFNTSSRRSEYGYIESTLRPDGEDSEVAKLLDQYSNGIYSKAKTNILALRAQRTAAFKVCVLEIIGK
ncbi:uncharacterized protein LOC127565272 [Drosophila albomicans]|uniref:Uncharacterized protein LOC127565272 n=1 Tax=Drosophila albomicans TaxID=7291 RepID=A0A9C6WDH6_DROAB|nr:uncharacterized protein LOC127565272 [Drosophila albomicans]